MTTSNDKDTWLAKVKAINLFEDEEVAVIYYVTFTNGLVEQAIATLTMSLTSSFLLDIASEINASRSDFLDVKHSINLVDIINFKPSDFDNRFVADKKIAMVDVYDYDFSSGGSTRVNTLTSNKILVELLKDFMGLSFYTRKRYIQTLLDKLDRVSNPMSPANCYSLYIYYEFLSLITTNLAYNSIFGLREEIEHKLASTSYIKEDIMDFIDLYHDLFITKTLISRDTFSSITSLASLKELCLKLDENFGMSSLSKLLMCELD